MFPLISIIGPTSSGKTAFSVRLALLLQKLHIPVEIISADSRQVYKELNLLSGKVTKKEMRGIPHHMLSIVSAKQTYSVTRFKTATDKKIKHIISRGHLPILVGGTGYYVDAVTKGIVLPQVSPNRSLRKKLSILTTAELCNILEILDPERSASIDKKNRVRLVRAIEIATALGKVPSTNKTQPYDLLEIYIDLPDNVLKKKIHSRLVSRIRAGMLQEAQEVHASGVSWKRMEELGLECRYSAWYLQGKISKKELILALETAIWKYAKRQRTWFKKS